jgi:hypothetical protein
MKRSRIASLNLDSASRWIQILSINGEERKQMVIQQCFKSAALTLVKTRYKCGSTTG